MRCSRVVGWLLAANLSTSLKTSSLTFINVDNPPCGPRESGTAVGCSLTANRLLFVLNNQVISH